MDTLQRESSQPSQIAVWLDRPLTSWIALSWETAIWGALLLIGAVMRLYELDVRAMSHDESLHALYAYYLYAQGNYDHNPMMHGPFRYHLTALTYFLFGDNDFTARLAPALIGVALIWMMYLLRGYLGRTGAILAGIMITISPSLLFHSRYIRDDIFMAFFTVVWIYGAFRYVDARRLRYLAIMVAGMAFGFVTMENHFIHGAIIGSFAAFWALWQVVGPRRLLTIAGPLALGGVVWWVLHEMKQDFWGLVVFGLLGLASLAAFIVSLRGRWHWLRNHPAADLAVLMLTMVLPFLSPFIYVLTGGDPVVFTNAVDYTGQAMIIRMSILVGLCVAASAAIGVAWFRRSPVAEDGRWRPVLQQWAALFGFFWLVQILFFTTFFTNMVQGLATGLVGSLGYWLAQQGVKRGSQPIYYYAFIGWLYEFLPAALSLFGIASVGYNLRRMSSQQLVWDPVAKGDLPSYSSVEEDAPDYRPQTRFVFVIFLIWWTLGSWIGYTVAGEKMPWLLTHMALPMCVLGGWWLGYVVRNIDWRSAWRDHSWLLVWVFPVLTLLAAVLIAVTSEAAGKEASVLGRLLQWLFILAALGGTIFGAVYTVLRTGRDAEAPRPYLPALRLLAVGLAAVLFLFTVRTSFMLTYINYDMATEYLVYAHASPDIKRALSEIDTISERTVGDRNIVVAYDNDSAWPLSWYMRLYRNARYYGDSPNPDAMSAPVVIVGPSNRAKVEPYMARDYVKRTYRRIWWPEMDYFDLTWDRLWGAIADPAQRQRVFDIVFFRKYRDPNNLSQFRDLSKWPYQSEFDMYVRRDLANQIWDLAVVPVSVEAAPNVPVIEPGQVRTLVALAIYSDAYNGLPLFAPRAVTVAPGGNRVIADTGNHRIVVLDSNGQFLRAFGSFCNVNDPANTPCIDPDGDGPLALGDGQFYEPWGVAIDEAGQIFVADTWNGRIQVFDSEGRFLRKWGVFATTGGELGDPYALFGPRGLAIDLDGNLLVADTGNKRILKFTPAGELIKQVGGGGVIAGRFEEPTAVAVDPVDGSVLVADAWNGRIQRLSPDLEYRGEFPTPGWVGRDVFQKPYLTVTADGLIYATDPATALVMVFDRDGNVVAAFGGPGNDASRIGQPNGIAADLANGLILVADGVNNRVMVFSQIQP